MEFVTGKFRVPWEEVRHDEVRGLRILGEERERYQKEIEDQRTRDFART